MKKKIAIIGGGACALVLACELDPDKFDITVYERNAALGRKFLVAGDGGLNLTHSENEARFMDRYTPSLFLQNAFSQFSNTRFIKWINELGIETFVGSSGRVFPAKGIKPVEVLNAFLKKIKKNSVSVKTKHTWQGFSENCNLLFENKNISHEIKSDIIIFCMGGASWPVTGSKGDWSRFFQQKNINVKPFAASNCSFKIEWDLHFISKAEGKILKNVVTKCGDKKHAGEIVITKSGIEGSGIYPLSPQIRQQLNTKGKAEIIIDLKPDISSEKIIQKLHSIKGGKNFTENLKKTLNINPTQIQLLKFYLSKEDFLNIEKLAFHLKNFTLFITAPGPVEEAISTVGGIDLSEIDSDFQLKKLPKHFVLGEMLDYDAPTGGYLLQSCFSMSKYLAKHLNNI